MAKDKEKQEVIVIETSVPVIAYAAPPRDSKGDLAKDDKGKTIKGDILGEGKTFQYALNQAGNDAYVNRFGIKEAMMMVNQKLITKKRNDLAAQGKAPEKGIKTKCKVMVDMIKGNKTLKPIFIDEVKTWKHIDLETREATIEVLKAV